MSFSEIPPPPEVDPGQDGPHLRVPPPGPQSRSWLLRYTQSAAPMGPRQSPLPTAIQADVPPYTIVYAKGLGSNVIDVDGNRYVDLAAGFGSLLLGHDHPAIRRVLELQADRLLQALGDVYPSEPRIALSERLARLHPSGDARVILGQSGADAVSAALKTAALRTGKPGVVAFHGAYHGLSYGPLASCGLRESYREPFAAQLNPGVRFVPYPADEDSLDEAIEGARFELAKGEVGAILVEPILGRGGCIVPPASFLPELGRLAKRAGALLVADEIWTGLGRSGRMLMSTRDGFSPDLICLGKGLGGGLPISACIGTADAMQAWSREREVVHTATFAGAPLACATAIATLDTLSREKLVERSAAVGAEFSARLSALTRGCPAVREVRGAGLMLAVDLGDEPGEAVHLARALLARGYLVTTGGGAREVLVLTPPLNISERLLEAFSVELDLCVAGRSG
jgi:4-aminobutyrate aminotransferase/(S)-3-amino-2-methylpropionate transaminase